MQDAAVEAARRLQQLQDVLEKFDEFGAEKRTVQREAILRKAFQVISCYGTYSTSCWELLYANHEKIRSACRHSLQRGSAAEQ